MLRSQSSALSSKELTPSITALKRRGVVEESHVEAVVKQYNVPESRSMIRPPTNLASIFEDVSSNAALKRARSANEDLDGGIKKAAAGFPSGSQKPSKIYRPNFGRGDVSPPTQDQKRPDFVVPRSSPPLVTSTGLTMPSAFIDRGPTSKALKKSPGMKSGARRVPVKGGLISPPKEDIVKTTQPVPVSFVMQQPARDPSDDIFGDAMVPSVDIGSMSFTKAAENADFSFTIPDSPEELQEIFKAPEPLATRVSDSLAFESLNPSRRRSLVPPSPFGEPLFDDDKSDSIATDEIPNVFFGRTRTAASTPIVDDVKSNSSPESLNSPLKMYSAKTPRVDRKDSPKPMGSPLLTRTLRQQLEITLLKDMRSPSKSGLSSLSWLANVTPMKIKELLRRKSSVKTSPTKGRLFKEEDAHSAPPSPGKKLLAKMALPIAMFVLIASGLSLAFWFSLTVTQFNTVTRLRPPRHTVYPETHSILSLPIFGPLGVVSGLSGSCGDQGKDMLSSTAFEVFAETVISTLAQTMNVVLLNGYDEATSTLALSGAIMAERIVTSLRDMDDDLEKKHL
ncbi:hypothetical protein BC829DRAFT_379393, partial [Chytridium lagenaria]